MAERLSGNAAGPSRTVDLIGLIRTGRAGSRAELAKATGLSPSTVATRIDALIARGHVAEVGEGESRGGRRPRRLEIRADAGLVGCIDLGVDRTSFGVADFAGNLLAEHHAALDLAAGPEIILTSATARLKDMVEQAEATGSGRLRGVSVGVPGPVSSADSRIVAPSRMPGWNGTNAAEIIQRELGVPVIVNNDANLMAAGELLNGTDPVTYPHQIFVKAGTGIGCGIIAGGELYKGSNGWAGDISHAAVQGAPAVPCSCGRTGCLDVLASGTALVREMQLQGHDVQTVEAMIDLARDAHPAATGLLRGAGVMTGGVLATSINFFNPNRLVLGGVLAGSAVFVAAVRSTLYSDCPPMATAELVVEVARHPQTGGLRGAARVMLDDIFSGEEFRA
ncbi:ROK family transcriptional regulator [Arthrobacter sp. zg-Y1143]|uniref:ROK family transcriptional regulator n=1 Tax=Arthrobacter sp. zg-Y1143 TaxID=3049065 RepID=UPI0024C28565|nr:ROK family transcriptional regulator [Arthrobacter sp. zg-Y1143]MDK1327381.1 ROK family transcriptional regulator [Arthrobacter sp. zg-Y1143]